MRLALVVSVLLSASAAADTSRVLTLKEVDQDTHSRDVTADVAVVDIGSTLRIGVSRDSAVAKVGSAPAGVSERTAGLVANYKALADALSHAGQEAAQLEAAMQQWAQQRTPASLTAFQQASSASADTILSITLVAAEGTRFRAALNDILEATAEGASDAELFRRISDAAVVELDALETDLRQALQEEGVYFVLGAWLVGQGGSRALHLEGFDDLEPPERYELDRWTIFLTQEQEQQLESARKAAEDFNKNGAGAFARTQGLRILTETFERTVDTLGDTQTAALQVVSTVAALDADIRADVDALAVAVRQYRDYLAGLVGKYRAGSPGSSPEALLSSVNADLREVVLRGRELGQRASALQARLATVNARLKPSLTALDTALNTTGTALKQDIDSLAQGLGGLFSLARANTESLEFAQEVKRHTLASLPSETVLDLNNAGRREAGDAVVLRFAVGRGEAKPTVVETRQVTMYRVLPHFETTVGLIFARVPDAPAGAADFQAAPAYSVLLKWGSRKKSYVNTLLTPGVGLNLSALDFNRDNTPEVGVAMTLSLFRNIVQVGGGYNFFQDGWYYFIGIGLPLPNIGGLPSGAASAAPGP